MVTVDVATRCGDRLSYAVTTTGPQLRKSEQNGFHDDFLISQPNPMM